MTSFRRPRILNTDDYEELNNESLEELRHTADLCGIFESYEEFRADNQNEFTG